MHPDLLSHPYSKYPTLRTLICLFFTITFSMAVSAIVNAQGFGIIKVEGEFRRTHPPLIYLPTAPVVAQVQSQTPDGRGMEQRLEGDIEHALSPSGRPILIMASTVHNLLANCTILDMRVSSQTVMRSRSVYKKTGQHTITDVNNNTTTVDDYGYVSEDYWVTINKGNGQAYIEIIDPDTGLMLDQANVSANYYVESEFTAPLSNDTIRTYVADALVSKIAARYAEPSETVRVALPKGKLKGVSDQLAAGRWNMALELLRTLPQLPDPRDDAYRLYCFGIAYEGLAWDQAEASVRSALLHRAMGLYMDAAQRKKDEGRFLESRLRAELGATELDRFLNQASGFEAARFQALQPPGRLAPTQAGQPPATAQAPPVLPASTTNTPPPSRVPVYKGINQLTDKIIIQWVQVGIPEDEIITNITQSRANDFDLSPKALVKLKQAGVSDPILLAMQRYQSPQPTGIKPAWFMQAVMLAYTLPFLIR
jgi:hypothetical protein